MSNLIQPIMESRPEAAQRNRHDWKRPVEPKPQNWIGRAMAARAAPMKLKEAQGILALQPPAIGTIKGQSRRYVEAWMVQSGASPRRIKAVRAALARPAA